MRMLKLVSIAIGVLSLVCAMPARAESAPWCAYKSNGGTYCGFYLWEQCQAGTYGNSYCARNPWYSAPRDSHRRQRRSGFPRRGLSARKNYDPECALFARDRPGTC
jgi:Protein of unknown function (DUF3551)